MRWSGLVIAAKISPSQFFLERLWSSKGHFHFSDCRSSLPRSYHQCPPKTSWEQPRCPAPPACFSCYLCWCTGTSGRHLCWFPRKGKRVFSTMLSCRHILTYAWGGLISVLCCWLGGLLCLINPRQLLVAHLLHLFHTWLLIVPLHPCWSQFIAKMLLSHLVRNNWNILLWWRKYGFEPKMYNFEIFSTLVIKKGIAG